MGWWGRLNFSLRDCKFSSLVVPESYCLALKSLKIFNFRVVCFPHECVQTELVGGCCGRLSYLIDCRFLRMVSARILYVRHSSHCKTSSFSCIRNQRSACKQRRWIGVVV